MVEALSRRARPFSLITFIVASVTVALSVTHVKAVDVGAAFDDLYRLASKDAPAPTFRDAFEFTDRESIYFGGKDGNQKFRAWPILYDALSFEKRPTKVFAWVSLPVDVVTNDVARYNGPKVPAVVMLHGGGGTAYPKFLEKWAARGYAAISIAHEGQTDIMLEAPSGNTLPVYEKHDWPGPNLAGGSYADIDVPVRDQWIYHVVADAMLANSLMRSFEVIDDKKIGLMGISWGAVASSTTIGFDPRFAYMVAGYGCGSMSDALTNLGESLRRNSDPEVYDQVWDPVLRFQNVRTPTYWISSPQDFYFPLKQVSQTVEALPRGAPFTTSFIVDLPHNHKVLLERPEVYEFASYVLKTIDAGEQPNVWAFEKKSFYTKTPDERVAHHAVFDSSKEFHMAELVYANENPVYLAGYRRRWHTRSAKLEKFDCDLSNRCRWKVASAIPQEAMAWYFNLHSLESDLIISSKYVDISMKSGNLEAIFRQ